MTTTKTDTTPRVWIGCLACYNEGRLVGDWHPALGAHEVSAEDLHGHPTPHEELWCLDSENIPVNREMSPVEANSWGEAFDQVGDDQRAALYAWVASGDYEMQGTSGDLPSVGDFQDRYCGEWGSFREYAEQYADDIGLLLDVPEAVTRHFDWDSWTQEMQSDYTTCRNPDRGVFIFRSI